MAQKDKSPATANPAAPKAPAEAAKPKIEKIDEAPPSPRNAAGRIDPDKLSPAAKTRREKVLTQKDELTKRISESTRTLAFGSLAACYGLLLADKDLAPLFASSKPILFGSGAAAISAIVADALQYLFGYMNAKYALDRDDQKYPTDWTHGGRHFFFVAKQVLAYLAAALLLWAIVCMLVR